MNQILKKSIIFNTFTLACGASLLAVNQKKMNVILIMADDVGYECIGAYGSTYNTPYLDRMAEKGMIFMNCHSQPLSTPSRVQIMTGKYNNRNYTQFGYLNPQEKTFAHLAKEAGYTTCIAGKWQLGYDNRLPKVFGFDSHCLWQLSQERAKGERYANVLYEKDGKLMNRDVDVYGPDVFVEYIMDFVKSNKDEPFFVYYPMVLAHDPFYPTPDSEEWKDPDLREKSGTKHFAEMITYMDKNVGKIIEFIKSEGLDNNTLILFTGDNGTNTKITTTMKDGSQIIGGKKGTKSNGTHVPLIAYGPNVLNGKKNENLIDFSDFYPTLMDAFGMESDNAEVLDGISFFQQLSDKPTKTRDWSFCHYQDRDTPDYIRFVQTVDYKLYQDGKFYNKKKDPDEIFDIKNGTLDEEKLRIELQGVLDQYPVWGEGILTTSGKLSVE